MSIRTLVKYKQLDSDVLYNISGAIVSNFVTFEDANVSSGALQYQIDTSILNVSGVLASTINLASGSLHNEIVATGASLNSKIGSTSGALSGRITTLSGYVNSVSGNLLTAIGNSGAYLQSEIDLITASGLSSMGLVTLGTTQTISGDKDFYGRARLYDAATGISLNSYTRKLTNSALSTVFDWQSQYLSGEWYSNSTGTNKYNLINYSRLTGVSGALQSQIGVYDTEALYTLLKNKFVTTTGNVIQVVSGNKDFYSLLRTFDTGNFLTLDSRTRTLNDSAGNVSINWSGRQLSGEWISNVTGNSDNSLVTYGTITNLISTGLVTLNTTQTISGDKDFYGRARFYDDLTGISLNSYTRRLTDYSGNISINWSGRQLSGEWISDVTGHYNNSLVTYGTLTGLIGTGVSSDQRTFVYIPDSGYDYYWVPYSGGNLLYSPEPDSIQLTYRSSVYEPYVLQVHAPTTSGFYAIFSDIVETPCRIYVRVN